MSFRCKECGKLILSFTKNTCSECERRLYEEELAAIRREQTRRREQSRNLFAGRGIDRGHVTSPARRDDDDYVVRTYDPSPSWFAADDTHTRSSSSSSYSSCSSSSYSGGSSYDGGSSSSCDSGGSCGSGGCD